MAKPTKLTKVPDKVSKELPIHFPKIREARELLLSKAKELIELKLKIIQLALDVGDMETADKALNFLLEHFPVHEGISLLEGSVDKPKQVEASKGTQIQIGIALGGVNTNPKLLPAIDVKAEPVNE